MGEPSALFARIAMSRGAYENWLASPVKFLCDYSDWPQMNPRAASSCEEWSDTFPRPEYMSVSESLETFADCSRYFLCEYDDDLGALFIADAKRLSSMIEIAVTLASLRNISSFKDLDEPGFIYVFPVISGGDPEALLRIDRGKSTFVNANDSSPEILYFANEAEEFIESLLEDDEN
ncbi:MAG: hypothetical protein LBQ58_10935 [Synergistaceae bacterium]|jgi:hypothetical protein|nr:hypothetical protein [Synergistaceae bacterium]